MQLCIHADYVTLGDKLIGTTSNALGNLIAALEREFPSDDYTSESYILNCLQRKRKAEKNDLPLVSLHSFRHLNASLLINSGADIVTVSSTLGHAQTATTLSVYAHAFQKSRAQALAAVADVLDNRRKKSG